HRLPDDPEQAARGVSDTPWADSLLLDAALEGTQAMRLGRRASPDVLILGLSATDEVGHRFGPDSRELHDQMLRLDHWLGWFLDSLSTMVPAGRTVIALSADHGVTRIPEVARARGEAGGRVTLEPLVSEINRRIGGSEEDSTILLVRGGLVTGNPARLRAIGVSPESLATALLGRVWRVPGIADAWTPATLAGAVPTNRFAARWARSIPRGLFWFVAASPDPGWVWGGKPGGAEHGASTDDDASVPIAFFGPGVRAGIFPDTVLTVDIAPTLARLLGVPAPDRLDGRRIREVMP
ncbi:MAG: alkaline phosphatase family protein, partial [Gemmatimonadota bacterium]|nr:alkaline phosphatase family protein [Gemmatimonadota bacterium]